METRQFFVGFPNIKNFRSWCSVKFKNKNLINRVMSVALSAGIFMSSGMGTIGNFITQGIVVNSVDIMADSNDCNVNTEIVKAETSSNLYPLMEEIPIADESDFSFYEYNDGVIVGWYRGSSPKVRIPDTLGGKPVVGITNFFEGNQKITHIVLPDSLLYAAHDSFCNCINLKEIYLGSLKSGLDWHGLSWLLKGCTSLEVLSMSDNANFSLSYYFGRYGDDLFYDETRDNLKKIYIGSSMEDVSVELFYGDNLEWVEVGKNNQYYSSDNGVVYNSDKKVLMVCGTAYPETDYIIPNGTQTIYSSAFQNCKCIKNLTIPDSVTEIKNSFAGCDSLTIYGTKGSYAETYANQNNIPFVAIKSSVLGDTNGDGKVTIADSLMIARYEVKLRTLTDEQLAVSDVNYDGKVTISDALKIARYEVKLIDSL